MKTGLTGNWIHVSCSYSSDRLVMYINGVQEKEVATSGKVQRNGILIFGMVTLNCSYFTVPDLKTVGSCKFTALGLQMEVYYYSRELASYDDTSLRF